MAWYTMQFQSFGEFSLSEMKNAPSLIFLILTYLILNLVLMNLLIGICLSLPRHVPMFLPDLCLLFSFARSAALFLQLKMHYK
jgi:hypothetical protein